MNESTGKVFVLDEVTSNFVAVYVSVCTSWSNMEICCCIKLWDLVFYEGTRKYFVLGEVTSNFVAV